MSKKELRDKYEEDLRRLENDVQFLTELSVKEDQYIPQLIELTIPTDRQLAQKVVDYNTNLADAVAIATAAISCGCSVSIGVTYHYERARGNLENISGGNYGGDEPYGDNGTVDLTSGIGSATTINTANLGRGVDSFVATLTGIGNSVVLRTINTTFSSSCGTSCAEFLAQQQAAVNAANNAQTGRTPLINASDAFKEEIKEYEIRKWAAKAAIDETQSKINRINNFLPNIQE